MNDGPRESQFLADLLYSNGSEWHPLPSWAHFFVTLGDRIASYIPQNGPLVVVLSLPTRAYAAALAGAGVVLSRAQSTDAHANAESHFKMLCELVSKEPNIPVDYIENVKGKLKKTGARLQGVEIRDGVPTLVVLTGTESKGGLTSFINERSASKVQLARKASLVGRSRSLQQQTFLIDILGSASISNFLFRTRLDCAIVGTAHQLKIEIMETPLGIRTTDGKLIKGHFQDILRVRRFLTDSQHYRSDVFPIAQEGCLPSIVQNQTNTVIFDGANGFLKWRDECRGLPWLVLLDRTELHFAEAVEAVKIEDMNRVSDAKSLRFPVIPPGIEITTFEVAA